MSALGWRSAILADNRCPLMCEVAGKRWLKYITKFTWIAKKYKAAKEVPETNTYQCHMQNHIWGYHVQYNGTLSPLQYLITSYDMGTRPCILQRWIKSTIYNDESSKYGSCVTNHNIILSNLGYKYEPKVFIKIQWNQYKDLPSE